MFLDLLSIEEPRKCSGSVAVWSGSLQIRNSISVPDSDPDPGRWKYILNLHRRWCTYYNQHIGRVKKSSRLQKRHTGVTKSCSTKKRWTLKKIYWNAATYSARLHSILHQMESLKMMCNIAMQWLYCMAIVCIRAYKHCIAVYSVQFFLIGIRKFQLVCVNIPI